MNPMMIPFLIYQAWLELLFPKPEPEAEKAPAGYEG